MTLQCVATKATSLSGESYQPWQRRFMKTCSSCGKSKEESSFCLNRTKRDGFQDQCRECHSSFIKKYRATHKVKILSDNRNRVRSIRKETKDKIFEYLSSHPCVDCGESDPVVLQFDHIHGRKKDSISSMIYRNTWKDILNELEKCEVRCANCHVRRHRLFLV